MRSYGQNLPLLQSKDSMRKAGVTINFVEDTAIISGEKIDLDTTSSGHYIILLKQYQDNIFMTLDMRGKSVRHKNKTCPIVEMSSTKDFNNTVAMDLKQYGEK